MKIMKRSVLCVGAISLLSLSISKPVEAAQIECQSLSTKVKGVTNPDATQVTTLYQDNNFNPPQFGGFQTLLSTQIVVGGPGGSCLIAHFSAEARPTDNYIMFQVAVDGVPMEGHSIIIPSIPVPVVQAIDETDVFDPNLFSEDPNPPKMVAYNFFKRVTPGVHKVEVFVAAGSAIDPAHTPSVRIPTLTLEYR